MSFIVVFVFVMSIFPANVFAHTPNNSGHGCQDGPILNDGGDSVKHKTTVSGNIYRSNTEDCNESSGLSTLLGLVVVGLIVWAVWPKNKNNANTNFEDVGNNLSATESTNNWGWTASYDYEEDSYSLGASYGF